MSVVNEKTLFKYNRWKKAEEDDKSVLLLPTYYGKKQKQNKNILTCASPKNMIRKLKKDVCEWKSSVQI